MEHRHEQLASCQVGCGSSCKTDGSYQPPRVVYSRLHRRCFCTMRGGQMSPPLSITKRICCTETKLKASMYQRERFVPCCDSVSRDLIQTYLCFTEGEPCAKRTSHVSCAATTALNQQHCYSELVFYFVLLFPNKTGFTHSDIFWVFAVIKKSALSLMYSWAQRF